MQLQRNNVITITCVTRYTVTVFTQRDRSLRSTDAYPVNGCDGWDNVFV